MSQYYTIIMKNGEKHKLKQEQYDKIIVILSKPKNEIPSFIFLDKNAIRVDFIASITSDSW